MKFIILLAAISSVQKDSLNDIFFNLLRGKIHRECREKSCGDGGVIKRVGIPRYVKKDIAPYGCGGINYMVENVFDMLPWSYSFHDDTFCKEDFVKLKDGTFEVIYYWEWQNK